ARATRAPLAPKTFGWSAQATVCALGFLRCRASCGQHLAPDTGVLARCRVFGTNLPVNADAAADVSSCDLRGDIGGGRRQDGRFHVRPRQSRQLDGYGVRVDVPIAHPAPAAQIAEDVVFDALGIELGYREFVARAPSTVLGAEDTVSCFDGQARHDG